MGIHAVDHVVAPIALARERGVDAGPERQPEWAGGLGRIVLAQMRVERA